MNEDMHLKITFALKLSFLAFISLYGHSLCAQSLKPGAGNLPAAGLSLRNAAAAADIEKSDQLQALDFIVAVVDNEPITNIEVNTLAAMADPAAARLGKSALLQNALENLINESAQLQVARQLNVQVSTEEIQQAIDQTAKRNKLSIEELTGGTFSISNGGVFGSMLSTPIINPPQSAILGIHATKDRAVVENGQVVVRPINYLAMSYDHRIIDGREAVLGLVAMKEALEDPARLLFDI